MSTSLSLALKRFERSRWPGPCSGLARASSTSHGAADDEFLVTAAHHARMPVRLPLIPEPLPDEILGSWLSRVVSLNGGGAWRPFIEDIGYPGTIQGAIFDMPKYSPRFAALIAALGRDYEQTMLELSTLPYWLTFDAVHDATSRLPGMIRTPGFRGSKRRPQSSTRSLGIAGNIGHARTPRYCPMCLEDDTAVHGVAYWHRAHQLPNVLYCHLHHIGLRTSCPDCGLRVVTLGKRLVPLPAQRCSCGWDLCQTTNDDEPAAPYLMLARLSAEALTVEVPRWDRDQVRSYLRGALRRNGSDRTRHYRSAIEGAFGAWTHAGQTGGASTLGLKAQHPELNLRVKFCAARAPECCAVMAALDLEFSEVIPEFIKVQLQWPQVGAKRLTADALDVRGAKEELLRRCAEQPGRQPSASFRAYWYLRLNDPDWISDIFPSAGLTQVPDVQADREVLQRVAANAAYSIRKRRMSLTTSAAGLRATFRDSDWLQCQLAALSRQVAKSRKMRRSDLKHGRLQALKEALQAMLDSSQRPERIFAPALASAVGLSHSQAGDLIREFPELKEAINKANADKYRRQVLWAARQLKAQGQPLAHRAILRKASLPTYGAYIELARAAVAAIQAE